MDWEGRKNMKLAHFACAVGKHSIDRRGVRKVFGMNVGRCAHCSTPLEEAWRDHWVPQQVRDAGLGHRLN